MLFGTTTTFLERLGLDSIDDLPPIAEFIPGADVVEALEVGLRVTPVIEVDAGLGDPRIGAPGPADAIPRRSDLIRAAALGTAGRQERRAAPG